MAGPRCGHRLWNSRDRRIGVVGIGGLGHLAVKFGDAWGCHVTAFTTNESKQSDSFDLGADAVVLNPSKQELVARAHTLDLLVTTQNVPIDWNGSLGMIKPDGRLHEGGAVLEPMPIPALGLITYRRSIFGSPVASILDTRVMIDVAARHGIAPASEHFPIEKINEAFEKLAANQVRYRAIPDITP